MRLAHVRRIDQPLVRSSQLPETHTHYIREQTLALHERVLAVTDA